MQPKAYVVYFLSCFILELLLFLCIQRPLFLFYNWANNGELCTFSHIFQAYIHGFPLDVAAACFLLIPACVLFWIHVFFPHFNIIKWLRGTTFVIALSWALIVVADTVLYGYWGFKLDDSVFPYLADPKNAMASVAPTFICGILLAWFMLSMLAYYWLALPLHYLTFSITPIVKKRLVGMMILSTLFVFAGIRGINHRPNSPAQHAFYSPVSFHNHLALNAVYNFLYMSVQADEDYSRAHRYFDGNERTSLWDDLQISTQGALRDTLLTTRRPDILVILLEGFGAQFIEGLGGKSGVAPCMNRLLNEGVAFTQCYCASIRTDRAMVATLSGFPASPTQSVMKQQRIVSRLPGLARSLKAHGYQTSALYGGDINFYNFATYLYGTGHTSLLSQEDFPKEDRSTQWGVPDHLTFARLLRHLNEPRTDSQPRYTTFLTLSSHDPFDVPYDKLADKVDNAFAYTDSCLGNFIDRLRETPAWENLWVICIADHAYGGSGIKRLEYAHIPLLMLGGAIRAPRRIDVLMSQTDLPATVLGQLGIAHDDFPFSRDVLADTYTNPFGFHTYNDGFLFIDSTGHTVYDNKAGMAQEGTDARREKLGKRMLQSLYEQLATY